MQLFPEKFVNSSVVCYCVCKEHQSVSYCPRSCEPVLQLSALMVCVNLERFRETYSIPITSSAISRSVKLRPRWSSTVSIILFIKGARSAGLCFLSSATTFTQNCAWLVSRRYKFQQRIWRYILPTSSQLARARNGVWIDWMGTFAPNFLSGGKMAVQAKQDWKSSRFLITGCSSPRSIMCASRPRACMTLAILSLVHAVNVLKTCKWGATHTQSPGRTDETRNRRQRGRACPILQTAVSSLLPSPQSAAWTLVMVQMQNYETWASFLQHAHYDPCQRSILHVITWCVKKVKVTSCWRHCLH